MKSVILFTTTQDELADIAPLFDSYNELGTRSIERAGRSCCDKLEFIFPITFHRKPSFLDLNSPRFSNTLLIYSEKRWLTLSVQNPLSLSLSLSLPSLSLLHFSRSTSHHTSLSLFYTTLLLYSITSTMPSITSFLWSLVGVTTSKRAVRLHSLSSLSLFFSID